MKVWFCRDEDGTRSVWDGSKSKPNIKDGYWSLTDPYGTKGTVMADDSQDMYPSVDYTFGPGFHGVRKGQCKLIDIEPVNREDN